jgi:predicted metal-dependent peptidase
MAYLTDEERLKKNHIVLMRHPETALYSGIIMMGDSEVSDESFTAYTDGVNKKYSRSFMQKLKDIELRGLILHENLHVTLMHIPRHTDLMKENHTLANVAMDLVVNDIIMSLSDKQLASLPEGGVYDEKFHGWSVREIYNHLKKENPKCDPRAGSGSGSTEVVINGVKHDVQGDEHDMGKLPSTPEEGEKMEKAINQAIREGGMLAGRLGAKVPRQVEQSLDKPLRWEDVLRDFVTSTVRGKDEYTWRRFNRALLSNDILAPSSENETLTEVIISIDTSGSINQQMIAKFAVQVQAICDSCSPQTVRVLWWDTEVHGEQVFAGDSPNIKDILKPMGGGGTAVSCVAQYILEKRYKPDCVVVFTDGYVEDDVKWNISADTLWLVTENERWTPPKGKKVIVNN